MTRKSALSLLVAVVFLVGGWGWVSYWLIGRALGW